MHPIPRLHGYIIPQIEGKFQSRVKNNSVIFRPGRGPNIVRSAESSDPTHPKTAQGEVGPHNTVFRSLDLHFLIFILYYVPCLSFYFVLRPMFKFLFRTRFYLFCTTPPSPLLFSPGDPPPPLYIENPPARGPKPPLAYHHIFLLHSGHSLLQGAKFSHDSC